MRNRNSNQSDASWKQFVFYGEIVGFLMVWVVGAILLVQSANTDDHLADTGTLEQFAEVGLNEMVGGELK